MNQQDMYENQLRMAREKDKKSPEELLKEQLKKEVKKKVLKKVLMWFCVYVLPWILLIGGIALIVMLIWFMACDSSTGGIKGWALANILKAKGLCSF